MTQNGTSSERHPPSVHQAQRTKHQVPRSCNRTPGNKTCNKSLCLSVTIGNHSTYICNNPSATTPFCCIGRQPHVCARTREKLPLLPRQVRFPTHLTGAFSRSGPWPIRNPARRPAIPIARRQPQHRGACGPPPQQLPPRRSRVIHNPTIRPSRWPPPRPSPSNSL